MISYHPSTNHPYDMSKTTFGYKVLESDDPYEIAKYITKHTWSGINWKKGHKKEENFIFSDWCLLDFDDPNKTIEEIERQYCDTTYIIGTTKSHRTGNFPYDRFRLAIPWASRIDNIKDYRFNMEKLVEEHDSDEKCRTGAHAFYRCTEIVRVNIGDYKMDWTPAPPGYGKVFNLTPDQYQQRMNIKATKWVSVRENLSYWIADFLLDGKPFAENGREMSCYVSAIELFEHNFNHDEVMQFLRDSPFDRQRPHYFYDSEIEIAVDCAFKLVQRRLTGNVREIRSADERSSHGKEDQAGVGQMAP